MYISGETICRMCCARPLTVTKIVACSVALLLFGAGCSEHREPAAALTTQIATGSSQCRSCHQAFYKEWATSHHGLAMQPFTSEFASSNLTFQTQPVTIGKSSYRAVFDRAFGYVEDQGPDGTRKLPILHVMGGKNVFYFLTAMDRGRLQVLPLAYDVHKKMWYDMAASGVRMHAGVPSNDALPWTDPAFTFNTSCYSCHVSQLQINYDSATGTYHSSWREPGINCESCHDDGQAHIDLYKRNQPGNITDLKILRITRFTTAQRNEMCAPCHAKMSPVSPTYRVTQHFFDHYDLVTLENEDFYPDGRDLGENYTYTGWLMSPCVRSGKLDCIHCHTSSGRYRFAAENPNGACMPCHNDKLSAGEAHTHHKAGTSGGRCIDCHMPKTRFANMNRSDHSMLPPTPVATLKYKSPNACNLCHTEKDASWADRTVRNWHEDDYQRPVLERAALIDDARKHQWRRLGGMLDLIRNPASSPVMAASLIRLLSGCDDPAKWPVIIRSLQHPDPLVRSAAATSFPGHLNDETVAALAKATRDEYRLVRIRAAASLASVPESSLPPGDAAAVRAATGELLASYNARPDDFSSQTNLGNFYTEKGELQKARQSYESAIRLRPDSVGTLVNASVAYARLGRNADAERLLKQAVRFSPQNAAANFNLGLLLAETGRTEEAADTLRQALASDPSLDAAAYNLCVILERRQQSDALSFCRQAVRIAPNVEKYAFTLAFYLNQSGRVADALQALARFAGGGLDTRLLRAELLLKSGKTSQAVEAYSSVLRAPNLDEGQRRFVKHQLQVLNAKQ